MAVADDVLRETFDREAERYDRARPHYPAALFADLARLTGIGPGSRVLEIGAGTGQATAGLVDLGADVLAIELGAALATVARRRLGRAATVVVADFDTWPLPAEPFDLVLAATSWHWLDRTTRSARVATALRPGGSFATIGTAHVAGGTTAFFAETQPIYEQWDPATPPGVRLQPSSEIALQSDDVEESGLFEPSRNRRYEVDIGYSRAEYLDVLQTYSGHIALPEDARRGLLQGIGELIDGSYGGSITKRYLFELRTARRISSR